MRVVFFLLSFQAAFSLGYPSGTTSLVQKKSPVVFSSLSSSSLHTAAYTPIQHEDGYLLNDVDDEDNNQAEEEGYPATEAGISTSPFTGEPALFYTNSLLPSFVPNKSKRFILYCSLKIAC